jgi:hypothetical protein
VTQFEYRRGKEEELVEDCGGCVMADFRRVDEKWLLDSSVCVGYRVYSWCS